jgi:hypothetical protein
MMDPFPKVSDRFSPQGPIDWALSKVFVESLFKPLLYSVVPDRLDPRDWMTGEDLELELAARTVDAGGTREDYWFDFVSDTGDSDVAMYSLAYLFHGDLALEGRPGALAANDPTLANQPEVTIANGSECELLPRGEFLFLGGDSAYPVAEQAALDARFTAPLNHAFERRFAGLVPPSRPLIGIPGNHDWYDSLDGFNRIFRKPTQRSQRPGVLAPPKRPRGYHACQQASYFTLQLPGKWQLWGFDSRDAADVDVRQQAFFDNAGAERPPRGLILATSRPAFVDGKRAGFVDELFAKLPPSAQTAARLWFSGDTHHYARYDDAELPGGARITSLVSGLGSAALHAPLPGGLRAAALHPTISEGNRAVLRKLARPMYMMQRRGLRRLGFVLGAAFGASALSPSGEVGSWVNGLLGTSARCELPLVLTILLTAIVTIVLFVRWGPSESEGRRSALATRIARLGGGGLAVAFLLILVAHGANRSIGSVLLDVAFELAALLFIGVGYLFVSGLGWRRSAGKVVGLSLVTLVLGAITLGSSVALTLICTKALTNLEWQTPWLLTLRFILATATAGALMSIVFPVLAGWTLTAAFVLETQRAFVSSFAAIDRYQAFVRFRLRVDRNTQESWLTGFVIAVTEPVRLQELRDKDALNAPIPKAALVDVFTLHDPGPPT